MLNRLLKKVGLISLIAIFILSVTSIMPPPSLADDVIKTQDSCTALYPDGVGTFTGFWELRTKKKSSYIGVCNEVKPKKAMEINDNDPCWVQDEDGKIYKTGQTVLLGSPNKCVN